jgi:hypothetical protein
MSVTGIFYSGGGIQYILISFTIILSIFLFTLFMSAGVVHVIVKLMGGNGRMADTFNIIAYSMSIAFCY